MLWVQLVSSTGALPSQSMHYRVPLNLPPLENVDAQHRNLTRLAKAIRKSFSIADSSVLVVACRDQASGSFEPLTTYVGAGDSRHLPRCLRACCCHPIVHVRLRVSQYAATLRHGNAARPSAIGRGQPGVGFT